MKKKTTRVVGAVVKDGDKYLCIKEEMDWDVFVGPKIGTVVCDYPDFSVEITAYLCKGGDTEMKLLEHLDARWLTRDELADLNWTEADRMLLPMI